MITKDRALGLLTCLDTIAFPALGGPSLYFKELERYILGEDCSVDGLPKRVAEEGTLLHKVKDLKWPKGAVCVAQDGDGSVKWLPSMPCRSVYGGSSTSPNTFGHWYFTRGNGELSCNDLHAVDYLATQILASDWGTAIITKEMWETVQ